MVRERVHRLSSPNSSSKGKASVPRGGICVDIRAGKLRGDDDEVESTLPDPVPDLLVGEFVLNPRRGIASGKITRCSHDIDAAIPKDHIDLPTKKSARPNQQTIWQQKPPSVCLNRRYCYVLPHEGQVFRQAESPPKPQPIRVRASGV